MFRKSMVVEHGGESCACNSRVSKEALLVVRERWLVVRWVQQLGVEIGAVNERDEIIVGYLQ